jgi:ribonuclease VapC
MNVLDASAVLAFLFAEEGQDKVAAVLDGALLSSVNLAEVLSRFARDGLPVSEVRAALSETGLEVVPFDDAQALLAAALVPHTSRLGLSLGDRACLALAATVQGTAITADRAWAEIDTEIRVQVLR